MTDPRLETNIEAPAVIRNEPVQARSAARLTALLDAAAHVVDEIGYERLTTAMVADRAGASIGTVYRYFPDRIAVLQSLAARNAERVLPASLDAAADSRHTDWTQALAAAFEVAVECYRTEPGFAALRFGDVLDLKPATGPSALAQYAERLFETLTDRFALDAGAAAKDAFEAAVVVSDAIAARAFARDPRGDEAMLAHGAAATVALLAPFWGDPRA